MSSEEASAKSIDSLGNEIMKSEDHGIIKEWDSGQQHQEQHKQQPKQQPRLANDEDLMTVRDAIFARPEGVAIKRLRKLANQGFSEDLEEYRGIMWRILLGYLPSSSSSTTTKSHEGSCSADSTKMDDSRSQWKEILQNKRQQYRQLVQRHFCDTRDVSSMRAAKELVWNKKRKRQEEQQQEQQLRRRSTGDVGYINDDGGNASSSSLTLPASSAHLLVSSLQEQLQTIQLTPMNKRNSPKAGRGTGAVQSIVRPPQKIPYEVKEAWKRKGRDKSVLESLMRDMNSLQVHTREEEQKELFPSPSHKSGIVSTELATAGSGNASDTSTSEQQQEALNESSVSQILDWEDFMDSAVLLDMIRKDVIRTHTNLDVFREGYLNKGKRRSAALERILFIWSKQHPNVGYVQGMNEIAVILYYVLLTSSSSTLAEENVENFKNDNISNDDSSRNDSYISRLSWSAHAEPDAYALLDSLLLEMRDLFVPHLDQSATGIQGRIAQMQTLLNKHDPEVTEHLQDIGIQAEFYAIRWWTTLLSREFSLDDTVRLWDSMFASTHRDNFLRYVCVTMVMAIREDLLRGDFSTCLRLLQSYPQTNSQTHIDQLLESTRALWIYESQITMACHKGGISLHQAMQTIKAPPAIIVAFGLRNGTALAPLSPPIANPPDYATTANRTFSPPTKSSSAHSAGTGGFGSAPLLPQLPLLRISSDSNKTTNTTASAPASSAMAGWFGKARGLYSKYSQEFATRRLQQQEEQQEQEQIRRQRSRSADGFLESPFKSDHATGRKAPEKLSKAESDLSSSSGGCVYLDAILNAGDDQEIPSASPRFADKKPVVSTDMKLVDISTNDNNLPEQQPPSSSSRAAMEFLLS